MRILLIGSRKRWRMEHAVQQALRRAGHETLLIDDRRARQLAGHRLTQRWALARAASFRPDFVFLSKCQALELDTVERIIRGRDNVMWYHDAPYFQHVDRPQIAHVAAVGRLARIFFVTGFEDEWRTLGLNAHFLPSAGDRAITPVPANPAFASEIAFIGTGYDADRARFLIELARHYEVRVWGPAWQQWRGQLRWSGRAVEGRDFAAVCSSSALTLGILPRLMRNATTSASDRSWRTILAGGLYLGPGTPGLERQLRDGEHCIWYADLASCVEKAGHYLRHPAERARIRECGERFVREHHTYDQRVRHLLSGAPYEPPL